MLPAPKPSGQVHTYSSTQSFRSANTPAPAPVLMSRYYDSGGSCFDGNGKVTIYNNDGTDEFLLPVTKIEKGHVVKTIDENKKISKTRVRCVIKSRVPNKSNVMCNINEMLITPWHPLLWNDIWIFPINIAPEINVSIDYIYNIVLESGHVIFINNTPVVTLGHNFKESVVAHPYYGSQQIIKDLSQMNGWDDGMIILNQPMVMRSDGLVTQLFNNNREISLNV